MSLIIVMIWAMIKDIGNEPSTGPGQLKTPESWFYWFYWFFLGLLAFGNPQPAWETSPALAQAGWRLLEVGFICFSKVYWLLGFVSQPGTPAQHWPRPAEDSWKLVLLFCFVFPRVIGLSAGKVCFLSKKTNFYDSAASLGPALWFFGMWQSGF